MRFRRWESRLAVAVCMALALGMLVVGREARSSFKPLVDANTTGPLPYRHFRPFHVRIIAPSGKSFTQGTTLVADVAYFEPNQATGKQVATWKVLGLTVDKKDPTKLIVLLRAQDPRASSKEGGPEDKLTGAVGTGTIVVNTSNPDTTGTEISVGANDGDECP